MLLNRCIWEFDNDGWGCLLRWVKKSYKFLVVPLPSVATFVLVFFVALFPFWLSSVATFFFCGFFCTLSYLQFGCRPKKFIPGYKLICLWQSNYLGQQYQGTFGHLFSLVVNFLAKTYHGVLDLPHSGQLFNTRVAWYLSTVIGQVLWTIQRTYCEGLHPFYLEAVSNVRNVLVLHKK